nr:winged helix-turn-helix domain-containing protein [Tahibacter harae]
MGGLLVDLRYRRVIRADAETELAQRVFDLLLLFLARPGQLHSRNEIFRLVWPGVVVEDANLTQSIWLLRRALGAQAKDWVRTVAKLGYVFDPPVPVEWPDETTPAFAPSSQPSAASAASPQSAPSVPAPAAAAAEPATSSPSPSPSPLLSPSSAASVTAPAPSPYPAAPPAHPRRPSAWLAAACLLAGLLGLGWWQVRAQGRPRVVLAAAADASLAEEQRWPLQLLQSWLEWKLRASNSLPLAAPGAAGDDDDIVVVLAVNLGSAEGEAWQLSARLRGAGVQRDFRRSAGADGLVQALDALSRDVHQELAPQSAALGWPALALDTAGAAEFAAGLAEQQRHRRGAAAQHYRRVLDGRPDFGYARLLLADNLSELGQQGAVEAQLPRLREWMQSLPPPARALHQAQALALAQDYEQAAAAFAALAAQSPYEAEALRLAEARNLRRAGRSGDALQRLAGAVPQNTALALPWLIERAIAQLSGGETAAAAASAAEAGALAQRQNWPYEQGRALLLLADAAQGGAGGDAAALYTEAEQRFAASEDRLGVLRARQQASLLGSDAAAQRRALDEVLAEARAAGNVAFEFDALRRAAFHHYHRGEMSAYRERLAQSAAVVDGAGDRLARNIVLLDLLHQELLLGEFDAAQGRLAMLSAQPLQGVWALWFSHFSASMAYQRGDYDAVLQQIERGEALAGGDTARAAQLVGLSCLRGAVALARGQPGLARNGFDQCRAPQLPHFIIYADLGEAELALQGGDARRAQQLIAAAKGALSTMTSSPDRSRMALILAPLLARSGELAGARELLQQQLPLFERAGYAALAAETHLALAEIALAGNAVAQAGREAAHSDKGLAADDWQGRRRLRTVQALLAQRHGDAAAAARELEALDADARRHGDVLAELLVHSLAEANPQARRCSAERHSRLLSQSGLRGASDVWLLASDVAPQLAAAHATP